MKKYELTNEIFKTKSGELLYRIKALKDFHIDEFNIDIKKGELGGFIHSEKNLSQEGTCWIHDNAKVYGEAVVRQDAQMFNNSRAYGFSELSGSAVMFDDSWIGNSAKVYGFAEMHNNSAVYGSGTLCGNASISKEACVMSNAFVTQDSVIEGNTCIAGNVHICGSTFINEHAMIYENVKIKGNNTVIGKDAKIKGNAILDGTYTILDNADIEKSNNVISLCCSKLSKDSVLTFYKTSKKEIFIAFNNDAMPLSLFIKGLDEEKKEEAAKLGELAKDVLNRA